MTKLFLYFLYLLYFSCLYYLYFFHFVQITATVLVKTNLWSKRSKSYLIVKLMEPSEVLY